MNAVMNDVGTNTSKQLVRIHDNPTSREVLTFDIAEETWMIEVLRIEEIKSWSEPNAIPSAPDYVKGVWDFRDEICPVIDMRLFFGVEPKEYSYETVVIVIRGEANQLAGIIVDKVNEVIEIGEDIVSSVPDYCAHFEKQFVHGFVKAHDKLNMLMDVDKIILNDFNVVAQE